MPLKRMTTSPPKRYQIVLPTFREDVYERYKAISRKLKDRGIDIGKTVPDFLIDALEAQEEGGFEGLKRYI